MKYYKIIIMVMLLLAAAAGSRCHASDQNTDPNLKKPGKKQTCPVCGMFVSLYPDWIAAVEYNHGLIHYFDGAKDMFKYLFEMKKWAPGLNNRDITFIGVTDYYTLRVIDAKKAFFVIGSDVLGPMGHELIPVKTKEDALVFKQDHHGLRIMTFDEMTLDRVQNLDKAEFN